MTPPPQKEYIITEEQVQLLTPDVDMSMYKTTREQKQESTINAIRSRPAPSPDSICPDHTFCRVNNGNPDAIMHFCTRSETAIRNATLDDVTTSMNVAIANRSFTDTDGDYNLCPGLSKEEIRDVIKSLRSSTPTTQEHHS